MVTVDVGRAAASILGGGLVAIPTETVYGLGADATDPTAVARIFAVKGRPTGHPLIVHVAGPEALDDWAVAVPPVARDLAATCWPGPLTMLLRRSPRVPDAVTGGRPGARATATATPTGPGGAVTVTLTTWSSPTNSSGHSTSSSMSSSWPTRPGSSPR